ncbi:hypothetical protein CL620_04995 [archaeon]|jgi:hypothetical protein|nr:hypothetical protein [archaeon]|tara:strand:+ start:3224 stop:3424 length:201 start_codon:yes stop_codon:yes gene_type:complete
MKNNIKDTDKDFVINFLIYRLSNSIDKFPTIETGETISFPLGIKWVYSNPDSIINDPNQLNLFMED